ncbi:hypothetical protein [Ralstonia pseudosolanacearum]|uniref:hypothetical protein n=1 Tax=Ralstonia pseudosolanacearum TaxID=1310165 RepID=UPI0018D142B1
MIANEVATADVPMIGGGLGGAVARSTTRIAGQIGREGEAAVRASCDIGRKETLTINGRTRIPDGVTKDVLRDGVQNNVGNGELRCCALSDAFDEPFRPDSTPNSS